MISIEREKIIRKLRYKSGKPYHGEIQRAIINLLSYKDGTTVRMIMRRTGYNDQTIQRALRSLRKQGLIYSLPAYHIHNQILLWYLNG